MKPVRITFTVFLPWSHLHPGESPWKLRWRKRSRRFWLCWLACETEIVW